MKKLTILFLLLFVTVFSFAQKIKAYEYWVDDDLSNKVFNSITPVRIFHLQADLQLSPVSVGFHLMNIRFADSTNRWSGVLTQYFMKYPPNNSSEKQIVAYEYWVDDNYSAKTSQNVTPVSVYHLDR